MPHDKKIVLLVALATLLEVGCTHRGTAEEPRSADDLIFISRPASLTEYDFSRHDLDGIDPKRITSALLPTESGQRIHILYIARDAQRLSPGIDPAAQVTVLLSHGTGGNLLKHWYRAAFFEAMGFNVLAYDYQGYGASEGRASEANLYADVAAAYDYLKGRGDVGAIVPVGHSLGGAPTIWLCSPESGRPVAACIVESTFSNPANVVRDFPRLLGRFSYSLQLDNLARIATVTRPVLLLHGARDKLLRPYHSKRLFAAVRNNNPLDRLVIVPRAGHNNVATPSFPRAARPSRFYSHPDELPGDLYREFRRYRTIIEQFIGSALRQTGTGKA